MRQTHYFVTPAFRTVIREQSISIQGPKIWDSLCMYVCMYTALVTHQYVMQMGWKKLHLHES